MAQISFARGAPSLDIVAVDALKAASDWAFSSDPAGTTAYGTSRGTGVLVKRPDGWKVAQYALTFPIPNDLAGEMTARIRAHEAAPAR